jgi:hypothetical protein
MKREARLLRNKATNSLLLAIEHFNRPSDLGRTEAVLIFLDHSFEMLLKACILHKGGRIREKRAKQTMGFDACVRKALTDGSIRFLTDSQVLTLQSINGLRDAAHHHLVDVPEQQLYLHSQAGVTLFADLLKSVFKESLADYLPKRVLPITSNPPRELAVMVDDEMKVIRSFLKPGVRRHVEARARVRSLAIVEAATRGEHVQPSDGDLNKVLGQINAGKKADAVFPGLASLTLSVEGEGIPFNIRFTKKEGLPIHIVPAGTPDAAVVAIKRVAELDFYALGLTDVAHKVGLSPPKTTAVIRHLKLQTDLEYFKEFLVGKTQHARYSPKAVDRIRAELPSLDMAGVWKEYLAGRRRRA